MENLTCFNVVHYQIFVLSQTKKYQFGMKITEIFIHMNNEVILLQTWRLSKKNHIVFINLQVQQTLDFFQWRLPKNDVRWELMYM